MPSSTADEAKDGQNGDQFQPPDRRDPSFRAVSAGIKTLATDKKEQMTKTHKHESEAPMIAASDFDKVAGQGDFGESKRPEGFFGRRKVVDHERYSFSEKSDDTIGGPKRPGPRKSGEVFFEGDWRRSWRPDTIAWA